MPIYVYNCKCGESTDILHGWPPPKTQVCPRCSKAVKLGVQMPTRYREGDRIGLDGEGTIRPT